MMGRYLVNKQIPCCRASARQYTTDAVEKRFDQKSDTRGAVSVLRMFYHIFTSSVICCCTGPQQQ